MNSVPLDPTRVSVLTPCRNSLPDLGRTIYVIPGLPSMIPKMIIYTCSASVTIFLPVDEGRFVTSTVLRLLSLEVGNQWPGYDVQWWSLL